MDKSIGGGDVLCLFIGLLEGGGGPDAVGTGDLKFPPLHFLFPLFDAAGVEVVTAGEIAD